MQLSLVRRKLIFLSKVLFVDSGKVRFRKYRLVPKAPGKRDLDPTLVQQVRRFLEDGLGFEVAEQRDKFLVLAKPASKLSLLRALLEHVSLAEETRRAAGGAEAQ